MFRPPPPDLHKREPLIHTGAPLWFRSHSVKRAALHFGKRKAYRWDAPDGDYGVLYLAADEHCAFLESIGRGALRTLFIPAADLKLRQLSRIRFSRELKLIDLVSSGGLTRLGAEGSLTSGAGYRNSQRWSAALRSHPAKPDGIYYRSRHDPARFACALYDHCRPLVGDIEPYGTWADNPVLLGAILDHYGFGTDL